MKLLREHLIPGGLMYLAMDHRHVFELTTAARASKLEKLNICVWNKTNAGMGSFYRSKHELIFVFKRPGAAHLNTIELGRHGRYRTNVWDFAVSTASGAAGRRRSPRIRRSNRWRWCRRRSKTAPVAASACSMCSAARVRH